METKIFEVRDIATRIMLVVISLATTNKRELNNLRRDGYNPSEEYYLFIWPGFNEVSYNPDMWIKKRTRYISTSFVGTYFNRLNTGDVIDVEYLIGESIKKKYPEAEDTTYDGLFEDTYENDNEWQQGIMREAWFGRRNEDLL
jgi:hypothetical protein